MKSFGGEGRSGSVMFFGPRGIAITPDNFILVCVHRRIQKISMDGECIASFRGMYSSAPMDIVVSPAGQVYISDCTHHDIKVLNSDLTFSHSYDMERFHRANLPNLCGIAINSQGFVYVACTHQNHIIKLNSDENSVNGVLL